MVRPSRSRVRIDANGFAGFEGDVVLANGGGFALVRPSPLDLFSSGVIALSSDAFGDGKRRPLGLRSDDRFDRVSHQARFEPPRACGVWQIVRLPMSLLRPTFRGRAVPFVPRLDPGHVTQIGLMFADRQAGAVPFGLRWIRAD